MEAIILCKSPKKGFFKADALSIISICMLPQIKSEQIPMMRASSNLHFETMNLVSTTNQGPYLFRILEPMHFMERGRVPRRRMSTRVGFHGWQEAPGPYPARSLPLADPPCQWPVGYLQR
ncbi:hypothetical protein OCU04_007029 [Sclerotinia nivalis]|uniref:Uncharacterized protein n=1 Tax=Sclerotinia nivalis TaxID=352851 RepID=A0A9X0AL00_9HELO|nr:hypothetical protein OCU04_007029 [Sclerotinia nivalis]